MLLCSVAMWAQTFTVDGITYKVTSTNPMEVQVGIGGNNPPAIEQSTTGSIDIPSSVTDPYGNSYSVTSIGDFAFRDCSGLTSITIPNSVKSIRDWAFGRCSGLTSITIPNSVTSIGSSAFSKCYSLNSIDIPNSVTSIGNLAFSACYDLRSVAIPGSVTTFGNYAFSACRSYVCTTYYQG